MATNPGMQITIGANVAAAVAGLNQVGAAAASAGRGLNALAPATAPSLQGLTLLGNASNTAAAGLGNVGGAASAAGRSIGGLAPFTRPSLQGLTLLGAAGNNAGRGLGAVAPGANSAGAALNNMNRATGAANSAITDFSRILQDAPFGTTGVINNIQQLPGTLQRLSIAARESGRSMGSLLLSSINGFGGIGLAVAAITSGFQIYQNGIAGFNRKTKEAKEAADEYTKSLEGIRSNLSEEAGKVGVLVNALQGETLTRKERKKAIEELKSINPDYFSQLKDEEGLINKLRVAYANYLSSLKDQFAVKAIDKQIASLTDRKLQLEISLDTKTNSNTNKELSLLKAKYESELAKLGGIDILKGVDLSKGVTDVQKRAQELVGLIRNLEQPRVLDFANAETTKELAAINKLLDGLFLRRAKFGKTGLELAGGSEDNKEDEVLKRLKNELQGYQKQLETTNKLREAGLLPLNRENDALQLQLKILRTLDAIDAREVAIKIKPELQIDPQLAEFEIQLAFREFATRSGRAVEVPLLIRPKLTIDVAGATLKEGKMAEDYGAAVGKAIARGINNNINKEVEEEINLAPILNSALSDIANSIGDALSSSGDISNIFQGVFQTIGAAFKEFGKALTAYGFAALALKAGIKNPYLAIAAGAGLIIAGALLQKSIPGFANGVTGFSGGLALVGERGPELVNLPRGADVIPNNQLDGFGGQQVFIPSTVLRGEDIYISYNKVNGRRRRI
jgi:hypothetical protein